jgi:hypothetical protein
LTDAAGVEDQQKERLANRLQSPGMMVQITLAVIQDFRKGKIFFVGSCAKFVIWMGSILWNEVHFAVLLHAVATTHDEHGLKGMLLQPIAFEEPSDSSDQGRSIPFAQALLDQETGIFVKGMPLKTALEEACRRLGNCAGVSGQKPVSVCFEEINAGLCLFPARSEPGADATAGISAPITPSSSPRDAYPVVSFLRKHGLA